VGTEDLTVVETHGTALQRAAQFGEAVRANYSATMALFDRHRPLVETPTGRRVVDRVRRCYTDAFAPAVPYMEAFARGLRISLPDVLEDNVLVMLSKSAPLECSGVVVCRSGQTVVAQNWDSPAASAPMAVLEIGRSTEGPDTVRFSSPIALDFWSGANPYGLCKGSCSGPTGDPIGDAEGVTGTLWGSMLYHGCRTVQDVRTLVERVPVVGKGANSVVVDRAGAMLWVQQGGTRYAHSEPETPYCCATGYRPGLNAPATEKHRAEQHRWQRLMQLCAEVMELPGDLVADVKGLLADHSVTDGHTDSAPCRHGGPDNSTQFSVLTDVTGRQVHCCGQPCQNRWMSVALG